MTSNNHNAASKLGSFIIVLGSTSAIKRKAVQTVFPEAEFHCYDVPSGVPINPVNAETEQGALNRCRAARAAFLRERKGRIEPLQLVICLGIENGLYAADGKDAYSSSIDTPLSGSWTDKACIAVSTNADALSLESPAQKRRSLGSRTDLDEGNGFSQEEPDVSEQFVDFFVFSDALHLDRDLIERWRKTGYNDDRTEVLKTFADVLHEMHPECDPKDPHTYLTGGRRPRALYLEEALREVRRRYEAHISFLFS